MTTTKPVVDNIETKSWEIKVYHGPIVAYLLV